MELQKLYQTATFNHDFGFKQYNTPHLTFDPRKQLLSKAFQQVKKHKRQGKFKVTTKPKVCFFDECAKQYKNYPSPSKYKTQGTLLKRYKSASLNKINLKVSKHTYIDNIEQFEAKQKYPGVGKFDLTKYTAIKLQRVNSVKNTREKQRIKNNNLDDFIKLASQVPGPGHFNPHFIEKKVKADRTDHKFWKQKHQKNQKKLSRATSCKLGPNTYRPVVSGTFDSIADNKSNQISRWSHGVIQIRKGLTSEMRSPSPDKYNTTHQWSNIQKGEKPIGSLNLLNRVSTARSFKVYH